MKKLFLGLVTVGVATLTLAGCGSQSATKKQSSNQDLSSISTSSRESQTSGNSATSNSQSASSASTSSVTTVDGQTAGVLVALLANPDWFKGYADSGTMYYGTNGDSFYGNETAGYNYVTAMGDPTSYIFYKVDGSTVIYKQWVAGDTVADGHLVTSSATLSRLENDFYSTESQKAEVQHYVGELKPESSYGE